MPDDNVITLATRTEDNRQWSVEQMLRAALSDLMEDIDQGKRAPDMAVVVLLDKGEDGNAYFTRYFAANMKASEVVALCEIVKQRFVRKILGD